MVQLERPNTEPDTEQSYISKLAEDAYEHPVAAVATGAAAVAGFLACKSVMAKAASRAASEALESVSSRVFYVEARRPTSIATYHLNQGTGFLVSRNGHIATARHVIQDAADITVFNKQGQHFSAKLVGDDLKHDIALLKLDHVPSELAAPVQLSAAPAARFCLPKALTLGHPSMSETQVSSSGRFLTERTITGLEAKFYKRPEIEGARQLVMDLHATPGYSGAPLTDLRGRVFGLLTEGSESTRKSHGAPATKILELMAKSGVEQPF